MSERVRNPGIRLFDANVLKDPRLSRAHLAILNPFHTLDLLLNPRVKVPWCPYTPLVSSEDVSMYDGCIPSARPVASEVVFFQSALPTTTIGRDEFYYSYEAGQQAIKSRYPQIDGLVWEIPTAAEAISLLYGSFKENNGPNDAPLQDELIITRDRIFNMYRRSTIYPSQRLAVGQPTKGGVRLIRYDQYPQEPELRLGVFALGFPAAVTYQLGEAD